MKQREAQAPEVSYEQKRRIEILNIFFLIQNIFKIICLFESLGLSNSNQANWRIFSEIESKTGKKQINSVYVVCYCYANKNEIQL